MPEAVIVAAARSPIGRAFKGSLTSIRPDDLTVQMVRAALAQVPQLDPTADRRPHAGLRAARRRAGLQHGPRGRRAARATTRCRAPRSTGTARRRCRPRAWRCTPSGRARAMCSSRQASRRSRASPRATPTRGPTRTTRSSPTPRTGRATSRRTAPTTGAIRAADEHLPDIYIAMGQTAENLARLKGVTREDMDHFGVRSQNLAEKAIANGFFAREITPVTLPDGTVVSADDGPRAGVTYEAVSQLKPVFRPDGRVTAGNCCPLNDGAAALVVMSDTKAAELGITPLARVVSTGVVRPLPRDHGPRPGGGVEAGAGPRGHDDRRHRPRRDQRGVRGAGAALGPRPGDRRGASSTSTAAPSRSATRSA